MNDIEKIEDAIQVLRICLNVLQEWKEHPFQQWDEMDFEKRCEYIQEKVEGLQKVFQTI